MAEKKIEDFGEKIEGARKDIAALRKGILELTTEMIDGWSSKEQEQYISKDLVWKRPDYQDMVDKGLDREIAYFIKTVRDALPSKPQIKSEEGRKGYVAFIQDVRDMTEKIKSYDDIITFRNEMINKYLERAGIHMYNAKPETYGCFQNKLLKTLQNSKSNLESAVRSKEFCFSEEEHLKKNYIQAIFSPSQYDKFKVENNTIFEGKPNECGSTVIYYAAETDGRTHMLFLQDEQYKSLNLTTDDFKPDKFYVISSKNKLLFKDIDTREEAERLALEWAKEAEQAEKSGKKSNTRSHKEKLLPPQLEHIIRTGEEHRENNMNISGEDILESFKLRGGQFGNWTNQNDRQANMNMLFDAFRDLAVALDISYEDISLNKNNNDRTASLAIAWGARGHSSALAHYEPVENVINLTKMRGAGSLAHEWGHALDCYVNEVAGLTPYHNAEKVQRYMATHALESGDKNPFDAVVQAMRYKETEDGRMEATNYYKEAKNVDKNYSKTDNGYWTSNCEMFARAFACYVSDKLAEKGIRSDYLTGHSEYTVFPTGEERKAINEAIDVMISELKEKGYLKHQVHDIQAEAKKALTPAPAFDRPQSEPEPDYEFGEQMSLFSAIDDIEETAAELPIVKNPTGENKDNSPNNDITKLAQNFEIDSATFDYDNKPVIRIKVDLPEEISPDDKKALIERTGIRNAENVENLANSDMTLYLDYDENGANGVLKFSVGFINVKELTFYLNDAELDFANQVAEQSFGHSVKTELEGISELAEKTFNRELEDKDFD